MKTSNQIKASLAPLFLSLTLFGGLSTALAQSSPGTESARAQSGLTASQVQDAMGTRRYETRECVFRSADSLPSEVNLTVELVITPEGLVRTASMFESNSESEDVDECVVELVRNIHFPSTSATLDAAFRYRFLFVTGAPRG